TCPAVLVAVMVIGNVPLAVGVPASVAVPSPLSVKVTPDGSEPASVNVVAVGNPTWVVTVNVPAEPTAKVVWLALVIAGSSVTVSVNDCVAFGGMPLLAVKVSE